MSADIAGFRTRFPEFADDTVYTDARVQIFLDDAALCIDSTIFDTMFDMAVYYLAAHELYLGTRTAAGGGGSVGPVSSKTAGGVTVARGITSVDLTDGDAYYTLTQYGIKFMNIRDKVKIPGFIALTTNRAILS